MKIQRRRIVIITLVLCNLLVYAGAIGTAVWNDRQVAEAESARLKVWDFWLTEGLYADGFGMMAVARPEIQGTWTALDIDADRLSVYTRAEYAMKFPPLEEREWGVIYFVPDPAGATQKALDRLNKGITESDKIALSDPLSYPVTVEDVIYNHGAVKALLADFKQHDFNNYMKNVKIF
jgi:hypothetical protein